MTIERAQVARSSENRFKYLLSGVKNRRNCVKNSGSFHLKAVTTRTTLMLPESTIEKHR